MFRRVIKMIKSNRRYMLFSFVLLMVGIGFGYLFSDVIQEMVKQQLKELERLAKSIQDKQSLLYMFWVIFKNNVVVSMMMIGLGVFFGILPFFGVLSNGLILGFILQKFGAAGLNPWDVLFLGILPHGIIELFAVILAASFGFKLGLLTIRFLLGLFRLTRSEVKIGFVRCLNELPTAVLTIIGLLLIAAVIETTVTPLLMNDLLGNANLEGMRSLIE